MNDALESLIRVLQTADVNGVLEIVNGTMERINFAGLIRVTSVIIFTLFQVWLLLFINSKVREFFTARRTKTHHLTIRNNGNTRSIFLLRTMDMPRQVALRFRVNGNPMIHVTQTIESGIPAEAAPSPAQEALAEEGKAASSGKNKDEAPLIPNLKNPMDAAGNAARSVGRIAGTAASAMGYMSTLSPVKSAALTEGQAVLKGVQQTTSDAMNNVGIKIRAFEALKNISDKIFKFKKPKKINNVELAAAANESGGLQGIDDGGSGGIFLPDSIRSKNLVYEETVWNKNIGKTDTEGGSLNYSQTKVLNPGESMKIDLELMNLAENGIPVSYYYKIEVLQVPMTKLPLSAPRQIINGIVTFPKLSRLNNLVTPLILFGLLMVSIQLIAAYSYWIY